MSRTRTSSVLISQKSARRPFSSSGVSRSEEKIVVGVTSDWSSAAGVRFRRCVLMAAINLSPQLEADQNPGATTNLRASAPSPPRILRDERGDRTLDDRETKNRREVRVSPDPADPWMSGINPSSRLEPPRPSFSGGEIGPSEDILPRRRSDRRHQFPAWSGRTRPLRTKQAPGSESIRRGREEGAALLFLACGLDCKGLA